MGSIVQDLAMTTLLLSPADLLRRRGLKRMRTVALSLLGFAALVFIATRNRDGAWEYVNATAEAAMVGALADWFAVTALFRHPMGIPVPHTAIIPKRKDMLGQSLEEFVTGNFLTVEAARERVVHADVVGRVGRWLSQEQHSAKVITEVAKAGSQALSVVKGDDVRAFVDHALLPRLMSEPISPVAGHLLESVVNDGAHHGLVDIALVEAHAWRERGHGGVDRRRASTLVVPRMARRQGHRAGSSRGACLGRRCARSSEPPGAQGF